MLYFMLLILLNCTELLHAMDDGQDLALGKFHCDSVNICLLYLN